MWSRSLLRSCAPAWLLLPWSLTLVACPTDPKAGDSASLNPDLDGDGWEMDLDCDDEDPARHPEAAEDCDGLDNDCDGEVDEDPSPTWYADADHDGYGDPGTPQSACTVPANYVADNTDCQDHDSTVSPGESERCNSIDDDCDGLIDEDATDTVTWYADADADGHGDTNSPELACEAPAGTVSRGDDCDDAGASVSPSSFETCDGRDEDCDGEVDEAALDTLRWYSDGDGDGHGDPLAFRDSCTPPANFVAPGDDCDDTREDVAPGEVEVCDGVDNNCDGAVDEGCDDTGDTGLSSTTCDGANTGAGFDDLSSMGGPGLLLGILHVPAAEENVSRIDVFTGEQAGTNTVAIWSDDPATGFPDSMLAEGSWVMSSVNGWQGADLSTCVTLTAGTRYWVVWAPINGAQSTWDTAGTMVTYSGSFDGGATWSGPYSDTVKYQLGCCE